MAHEAGFKGTASMVIAVLLEQAICIATRKPCLPMRWVLEPFYLSKLLPEQAFLLIRLRAHSPCSTLVVTENWNSNTKILCDAWQSPRIC